MPVSLDPIRETKPPDAPAVEKEEESDFFILDIIPIKGGEIISGGKEPSPSHVCGDRQLHFPSMISARNGFAGNSDTVE